MERCENRVIIKDSSFKHEKHSDCSSGISVSCTNNIPYHNIDCGDNLFCNKKILPSKKPFMMPNEMYISLNSDSSQTPKLNPTRNEKIDFFAVGCHSTPASPEETERTRNKQLKKDLSSFHSPIIDKKLPFSFSTSFVRTSRSEDHLRKSSLTTVNIDIEDELASSLDTLLDTKADDVFYDLEKDEGLNCSCPETVSCRTKSPDEQLNSSKSDLSPSSSETASVSSKVSVKIADVQDSKPNHNDPLSESSGSEIIPSDSSTTIRKDSDGSDDYECTSEQISAISSLDGASRATDSDLGSPVESLSPESELNLEEAWNGEFDSKDCVLDVFQDITNKSKAPNRSTKLQPSNIELNLAASDAFKLQPVSIPDAEKSPTTLSSCSLSVPKAYEDKFDISADSPTSQCSEDTFNDLSYHELTESYDEVSAIIEVEEIVLDPPIQRSESPPTDDDSDIESLHSFHYSPKAVDYPSAVRLAKRLYSLDGFVKRDVSRHLSKKYGYF